MDNFSASSARRVTTVLMELQTKLHVLQVPGHLVQLSFVQSVWQASSAHLQSNPSQMPV